MIKEPTNSKIRQAKEKAVGGKKDRCVKGKSCSAACIAANKLCLVELPEMIHSSVNRVANKVYGMIKGSVERVVRPIRAMTGIDRKREAEEARRREAEAKKPRKLDVDSINNPFIDKLKKMKSVDVSVRGNQAGEIYAVLVRKRVGNHTVEISLDNGGSSFNFTIDGRYDKPRGLTNKEGIQIARETEAMFSEIVRSMKDGTTVNVIPYDGDGQDRGEKRRRAYERFGFGSDYRYPEDGLFGKVQDGKIVPTTARDYFNNPVYNFSQKRVFNRVLTMYVALWGEEPT